MATCSIFDCYWYWTFLPLREKIKDDPDRAPSFKLDLIGETTIKEVAVYCDLNNEPEFVRFIIPNLPEKEIPQKALSDIQTLKEHTLSCLRLGYRQDITCGIAVHNYIQRGDSYGLSLETKHIQNFHFDALAIQNLFSASFEFREVLRLYVDGCDSRLPIQYRFLSFYKLLELRYRHDEKCDVGKIENITSLFESDFAKLSFSKSLLPTLHDLRDKCAHIRTGKGKRSILGVTHLNLSEAAKVEAVLPMLNKVCAAALNERAEGKLIIRPADNEGSWELSSQHELKTE